MSQYLHYNGHIIPATEWKLSPDNRSFRYGDGFFETMKVVKGNIVLKDLHFERLFSSLERLKFTKPAYFTPLYLQEAIRALLHQLNLASPARVRLTVYRGEGGPSDIKDLSPNILIQAWPLNESANTFTENGLRAGVYTDARKISDHFSSIKSNNYQCYLMAALWAKEKQLDEAILLNAYDRVADATIANVFIVNNGTVKTPALTEGCISGVMRKYILNCLRENGFPVEEGMLTTDELANASEIFITNAIIGIKWIKEMQQNQYACDMSEHLYNKFIKKVLW